MEEFAAMKRKQLQALCKKHAIPANKSNLEMARLLASTLSKPKEVGYEDACKDDSRKFKKVRFSPEDETREYEPSAYKQMGKRMNLRNRQVTIEEESGGRDFGVRRKRGLRGVSQPLPVLKPPDTNLSDKDQHSEVQDYEMGKGQSVEARTRTTRIRAKLEEVSLVTETETETTGVYGSAEFNDSDGNASRPKSRRNLARTTQQVVARRATRSGAKIPGHDSALANEVAVVQIGEGCKRPDEVENSFKAVGRNVGRRKSAVPRQGKMGSDELEVKEETTKRVRNSDLEVVKEDDTDVKSREEIERGNGPIRSLRRSRRNTIVLNMSDATVTPAIGEAAGWLKESSEQVSQKDVHGRAATLRSTKNASRHISITTSSEIEEASVGVGHAGRLKEKREPLVEKGNSTEADKSFFEDPLRRSARHASKSKLIGLSVNKKTASTEQKGISSLPIIVEHGKSLCDHELIIAEAAGDADHVSLNCKEVKTSIKRRTTKSKSSGVTNAFVDVTTACSDTKKDVDALVSLTETRFPTSLDVVGTYPDQETSENAGEPLVLEEVVPSIVFGDVQNLAVHRSAEGAVGDQSRRSLDRGEGSVYADSVGQELEGFQTKTPSLMPQKLVGTSTDQESSEIRTNSFALDSPEMIPTVSIEDAEKLIADGIVDKSNSLENGSDSEPGLEEELPTETCSSSLLNLGGGFTHEVAPELAGELLLLNKGEIMPNVVTQEAGSVEGDSGGHACPLETAPDFIMDISLEPRGAESHNAQSPTSLNQICRLEIAPDYIMDDLAEPKVAKSGTNTQSPTSLKFVDDSVDQKTSDVSKDPLVVNDGENDPKFTDVTGKLITDGVPEGSVTIIDGFVKGNDSVELKLTKSQTEIWSPRSPKGARAYSEQETPEIAREISTNTVVDGMEKVVAVPIVNHDCDQSRSLKSRTYFVRGTSAELEPAEFQPTDGDASSPEDVVSSGNQSNCPGAEKGIEGEHSMKKSLCQESYDASGRSAELKRTFAQHIGICCSQKTELDVTTITTLPAVEKNDTESSEADFQADGNFLTYFSETGDQLSEVKGNFDLGKNSCGVSEVSIEKGGHELLVGDGIHLIDPEYKDTDEALRTVCKTAKLDHEDQQEINQLEDHSSSVTDSSAIEGAVSGFQKPEKLCSCDILDTTNRNLIERSNANKEEQKDSLVEMQTKDLLQYSGEEQQDKMEVTSVTKESDDGALSQEKYRDCITEKREVKVSFPGDTTWDLFLDSSPAKSSLELVPEKLHNHREMADEKKYISDNLIEMSMVSFNLNLKVEETKIEVSNSKEESSAAGTGDHLNDLDIAGSDRNLAMSRNDETAGIDKATDTATNMALDAQEAENGGTSEQHCSPFRLDRLFCGLGDEDLGLNDFGPNAFSEAVPPDSDKKPEGEVSNVLEIEVNEENIAEMGGNAFISSESLPVMEAKADDNMENAGTRDGDLKFKYGCTDDKDYDVAVMREVTPNGTMKQVVEYELDGESYGNCGAVLKDDSGSVKIDAVEANDVTIGENVSLENIEDCIKWAQVTPISTKTNKGSRKETLRNSSEVLSSGKAKMGPSTGSVTERIVSLCNGDKYEFLPRTKHLSHEAEVKAVTFKDRGSMQLEMDFGSALFTKQEPDLLEGNGKQIKNFGEALEEILITKDSGHTRGIDENVTTIKKVGHLDEVLSSVSDGLTCDTGISAWRGSSQCGKKGLEPDIFSGEGEQDEIGTSNDYSWGLGTNFMSENAENAEENAKGTEPESRQIDEEQDGKHCQIQDQVVELNCPYDDSKNQRNVTPKADNIQGLINCENHEDGSVKFEQPEVPLQQVITIEAAVGKLHKLLKLLKPAQAIEEQQDEDTCSAVPNDPPSKDVLSNMETVEGSAFEDAASFGLTVRPDPTNINKDNTVNLNVEAVSHAGQDIVLGGEPRSSDAGMEGSNNLLGKQRSSPMIRGKSQRSGLIEGTDQNVCYSDMKENMAGSKRGKIGSMTEPKRSVKRRPLEERFKN